MAIYKPRGIGTLGPPTTKPSSGREEDLSQGPPDFKSSALSTRLRCLRHCNECSRDIRIFPRAFHNKSVCKMYYGQLENR